MRSKVDGPQLKEPSKWSPEMVDFVRRCLFVDPAKRATTDELIVHPFVAPEFAASEPQ